MGWPQCNSSVETQTITETSLFTSHRYTFHDLALAVSAAFGLVAIIVSFVLMFLHATHYSRPRQQRHIIRILFMVPIYALVSFLSIWFYIHSVYYEVLRDCYEAFAIASFFSLMSAYIAEDLHHQKQYFRTIKPKRWVWPMKYFQKCTGGEKGWLRTPRSGLTWFNVIFVGVFQYCFTEVAMTITAVVSQHWSRYCLESLNPAFAHVWVMVIEGVAVSIAMYCIIQYYVQIKDDVARHRPLLKVAAIKLVIFLSFWQTILISFLTSSGAIKVSNRIQSPDIRVGIPALLLCIEMAFFAVFHIWAFPYKPYVINSAENRRIFGEADKADNPTSYQGGFLGIKAALDCFNPIDILRSVGRSFKWLFRDRKHRLEDPSYAGVLDAHKMTDLDVNTAHGAAGPGSRLQKVNTMEEGSSLLTSAQGNPTNQSPQAKLGPFSTHDTDSNGNTPPSWTEVEKEQFQDQKLRRHEASRDDGFTQAQLNPYDTKHYEAQSYPSSNSSYRPATIQSQQPVIFPTSQTYDPYPGRNQNLPFVTRQDVEALQHNQTPLSTANRAPMQNTHAQGGMYNISNDPSRDNQMENVDVGVPTSLQPGAGRR